MHCENPTPSLVVTCLVALSLSIFAHADDSKWTPDDILLAETGVGFQIAPDGRWAVWCKSQMDKEKGKRIANLFLTSLDGKQEIQLTRGQSLYSSPRWSPDGKLISVISTRPLPESPEKKDNLAETQLWLIRPNGGEPWHVTSLQRGIAGYAWKDKDTIAFIAQEDPTLVEATIKKDKDTSNVVEDAEHEPPVRLFLLDVNEKKVTRVTSNTDWMEELWVSPDGRWAVTRHARSLSFEFDHKAFPFTFLTNLDTGASTQLFADKRLLARDIDWTPDSKGFYVTAPVSKHPVYITGYVNQVYYCDRATGSLTQVDLAWSRGLGSPTVHATRVGFIALLSDGVRYKPARYSKQGDRWSMSEIGGDHVANMYGWELGPDRDTLVYRYSKADVPSQWVAADLRGRSIRGETILTKLNPNYDKKPKPKAEVIDWVGARGDRVDGIVYYPIGYQEGTKYPLILSIHGGPMGTDTDEWRQGWGAPKVLLAQEGALVLEVNYHGSANYGLDWSDSIGGGNYYDLEIPDIEAGVDTLIARGLADPDRLATMGWSNGSILSIELVTRNPRYKAISAGAGDVEWISDWGNVDFGASFDNYYLGASPFEDPQRYIEKSPFFRLDKVTAPTIIYFGTEDRAVPPGQGWSHFRALQQFGKTDVKFILFPGEPHGLQKYQHQKRKVDEDLAWFARHFFKSEQPKNPAVKKGSPLDIALKISTIARDGRLHGNRESGALVPEIVAYEGLEISRFEITRAQYASLMPDYAVEPGTENFPANGISFEQATVYAKALSERIGAAYRLPNEDESKILYKSAEGAENTLDYWAGFAPNPDDAKRLVASIAALEGAAPLLREVGMHAGRGDDLLVFDLGGNAAEWTADKDGAGKLMGGSADQPADGRMREPMAGEAYRGFRLVREK